MKNYAKPGLTLADLIRSKELMDKAEVDGPRRVYLRREVVEYYLKCFRRSEAAKLGWKRRKAKTK